MCIRNNNRPAGTNFTCRLVFAVPPRLFHRDETTSVHLPGYIRLENFIVTLNFLPFTGTAAKTAPAPGLATYYTAEPLYAITLFASISSLAPGQVCGRTLPTRVSLASSFLTNPVCGIFATNRLLFARYFLFDP